MQQKQSGGIGAAGLLGIAMLCMTLDHAATALISDACVPLGIALHFVGRMAGPILFFLLVEGYYNTYTILKDVRQVALFVMLSWPAVIFYVHGSLPGPGRLVPFGFVYTALLCLLVLRARHEIHNRWLQVGAILLLAFASLWGEWPLFGVLLVLVFDILRKEPAVKWFAAAFVILVSAIPGQLSEWPYVVAQLGQLPALALLLFYNEYKSPGKTEKWVFLLFYPLHLALLGLVRLWLVR